MHIFGNYFGLFNVLALLVLAIDANIFHNALLVNRALPATVSAHFQHLTATNWMLGWLAIASLSISYCAQQSQKGHSIGVKVYPASYVAYCLLVLMTYRWLQQPLAGI